MFLLEALVLIAQVKPYDFLLLDLIRLNYLDYRDELIKYWHYFNCLVANTFCLKLLEIKLSLLSFVVLLVIIFIHTLFIIFAIELCEFTNLLTNYIFLVIIITHTSRSPLFLSLLFLNEDDILCTSFAFLSVCIERKSRTFQASL